MSDPKPPPQPDVALLCGPTEDRKGTRILRARDGALEAGEVRPAEPGRAILGRELVRLKPRSEAPMVCDVEVVHPAEVKSTGGEEPEGPAQVATDAYRRNWDRIFGLGAGEAPERDGEPRRLLN